MSSCASYVSCIHDVIEDVTSSQSRSNFEIATSPSILQLERRSKAQNIGNTHGYLAEELKWSGSWGTGSAGWLSSSEQGQYWKV